MSVAQHRFCIVLYVAECYDAVIRYLAAERTKLLRRILAINLSESIINIKAVAVKYRSRKPAVV